MTPFTVNGAKWRAAVLQEMNLLKKSHRKDSRSRSWICFQIPEASHLSAAATVNKKRDKVVLGVITAGCSAAFIIQQRNKSAARLCRAERGVRPLG